MTDKRRRIFQVNEIIPHELKFKHILSNCRKKHVYWKTTQAYMEKKTNMKYLTNENWKRIKEIN